MKVSVITATYNRPEYLQRALDSIASQTYKDYEVVVVNDGGCSVENIITQSDIKEKIKYIHYPDNKGLSHALNTAISNATGELIAYLDDDDLYFSHHLETLHNTLSSSNYHLAYSKCLWTTIDPVTNLVIRKEAKSNLVFVRNKLLNANFIHPASIMFYKKCLEKTGGYDENLCVLMDWDLLVRLSEYFEFLHVDNITCEVSRRTNNSNMTSYNCNSMTELGNKLKAKYLKKYIHSNEKLDTALRAYGEFTKLNRFLTSHFKNIKKKGIKKAAIFGASLTGKLYIDYLRKVGIDVITIFDNDPKKHGKKLGDIVINDPNKIDKCKIDAIIIASRGYREEIFNQMRPVQDKGILIIKE
jgi:glycosyltransferase involved in cell wall biosynthesis